MTFAVIFNDKFANAFGLDSSARVSPASAALKKLKANAKAKKRLANKRVEISPLTDTLNIFDTTIEDMHFFAEILGNKDYSYMPLLRLSSFTY